MHRSRCWSWCSYGKVLVMDKKLKCPNCGQTDKGFFEFLGVMPITNEGDSGKPLGSENALFGAKGLLCMNGDEGCGLFAPESVYVIDPETGDCAGSMPDDLF